MVTSHRGGVAAMNVDSHPPFTGHITGNVSAVQSTVGLLSYVGMVFFCGLVSCRCVVVGGVCVIVACCIHA